MWAGRVLIRAAARRWLGRPYAGSIGLARRVEPAAAATPLLAVEIGSGGLRAATRPMQKSDIATGLRLNLRDLRVVDPSFRHESPVVLARKAAIVVSMEHVRTVIQHDRVLVFDPQNPAVSAFIPMLQERLAAKTHPLPFEFRALEAMLVSVCTSLNRNLRTLTPAVESALDTLTNNANFGSDDVQQALDRLLPLENSLNEFSVKVTQLRQSFNEVLMNDEDMCEMYLTTKATTGHQRRLDQHEEVEMMFENYLKQVDSNLNEITSTLRAVKSTEHITQIRLDAMRNRILRLEVFLNMAGISLASGTLLAGLFGMNLLSGLEESPFAFYWITGGCMVTSLVIFRGSVAYLRYKRIFQ